MREVHAPHGSSAIVVLALTLTVVLNAGAPLVGQRDRGGQPAEVLPLFVLHTGTDAVGISLATEFRLAIGRNKKYALARTEQDASLILHMVTIETACVPASSTAAAIAVATNNRAQSLLDLRSITVAGGQTREMAERTLINIDRAIDEWRQSTR